jgi:hypothetical protein
VAEKHKEELVDKKQFYADMNWFEVHPTGRNLAMTNPEVSEYFANSTESLPVEIKDVEGAGRGTFAKTDFEPSDIVLSERPFLSAIMVNNLNCNTCVKPLEKVTTKCKVCGEQYCRFE